MEFGNIRRLLSHARRAVDEYHMIEEGDCIAVGVSGGKDSLALLAVMRNLQLFYPKKFRLVALTVDMGFEGGDFSRLIDYYEKLGVEYKIVPTSLAEIIFEQRKESNPCALCAKMRRGILHDQAKEAGCNKIALGHHFDDVVETFMMNLFNEGRLGTFSPVTYLSRKDLTMIRPFVFTPEKDIAYYVRNASLPVTESLCPEDKHTDREKYKQLLNTLEKENKGLRHRIFVAIKKADLDGYGSENGMSRHNEEDFS